MQPPQGWRAMRTFTFRRYVLQRWYCEIQMKKIAVPINVSFYRIILHSRLLDHCDQVGPTKRSYLSFRLKLSLVFSHVKSSASNACLKYISIKSKYLS